MFPSYFRRFLNMLKRFKARIGVPRGKTAFKVSKRRILKVLNVLNIRIRTSVTLQKGKLVLNRIREPKGGTHPPRELLLDSNNLDHALSLLSDP